MMDQPAGREGMKIFNGEPSLASSRKFEKRFPNCRIKLFSELRFAQGEQL
jgi:hypothetical protein